MDVKVNDDAEHPKLYLGLDLSTQQLKAFVVNQKLECVHEENVQFDSDLADFRTQGGVLLHEDPKVVTAPTLMWVKAVDVLMQRLQQKGVELKSVCAISGSGQQHGSVFWRKGARRTLGTLDAGDTLYQQLAGCFSLTESPVWMDSSTRDECDSLEQVVGGKRQLARITGSRAYERFTGSQILKIKRTRPEVYEDTERISLVSSFLASLLLGSYAAIDFSDGSGMNLLNIQTREWDTKCTAAISSDLKDKLGPTVASGTALGPISRYFVERYGFRQDCVVASFTGDNPASLVGMCLQEGDIAVSLGTSDTVFLCLKEPKPDVTGHVLCNPLVSDSFMALLCYKNGSITRQRVAAQFAGGDWDVFSQMLATSPCGNNGQLGFYFDLQEIHPLVTGDHKFNEKGEKVQKLANASAEVRACVEGQFLRLRAHALGLGFTTVSDTRILATGGASVNSAVLQVLADVFNARVYVQKRANSAAAGGALLARLSVRDTGTDVRELLQDTASFSLAASPAHDADAIYTPLIERYRRLELLIQQQA